MADDVSPPRMLSEPPSGNLVPSSSTLPPTQTTSRGRFGAYYAGPPTGRPRYTFWPDGARPTKTASNPQASQNDRQPPETPSNSISNHQECGAGSVCHNINIAGNGVTVNNPAATYVGPQSEPGAENPNPQGRPRPAAHLQDPSRHGSTGAYPGPPPAPRTPHAGLAPGAASSFWTSAGQGRAAPAGGASNWRTGQDWDQTGPSTRRDHAADSRPRRSFDGQRQARPAHQQNIQGLMGTRPRRFSASTDVSSDIPSSHSSTTGSVNSRSGYASAFGDQPVAARRLLAAYPASLLSLPAANQPPPEAQVPRVAARASSGLRRSASAPSLGLRPPSDASGTIFGGISRVYLPTRPATGGPS
ncbi:hypothetical protein MMC30_003494 [Trapelia coarctata]|nr:hypothetical protein [Trapelia coarctata]